MPIVKTFELKADVDQAQKNLDEINETLEVQDEIVNKLQNDLANYEAQLWKNYGGGVWSMCDFWQMLITEPEINGEF